MVGSDRSKFVVSMCDVAVDSDAAKLKRILYTLYNTTKNTQESTLLFPEASMCSIKQLKIVTKKQFGKLLSCGETYDFHGSTGSSSMVLKSCAAGASVDLEDVEALGRGRHAEDLN